MRILQIVPEMNVGGVETGTVDVSLALHQQGHEVFVISHGGVLVRRLLEGNISHITLPVHRKELFSMLLMAWRVRRIIKHHGIDIVHARSRVPGWIAFAATRGTRAKYVTTAHGAYGVHLGSRVMGWGERVIVPSTAIRTRMQREFGVKDSELRLIPRGVDLKRFETLQRDRIPEKGPVVVGMVGRITTLKGHETFLRALAQARIQEPRLLGRIVGDSPRNRPNIKENLQALASELGLHDHMIFEKARADVEKVYAELDILVMASIQPESFGRVLVEAQAGGVPVVASALGGALDIAEDGKTGSLFPAGDVNELARVLLELVTNPARARVMAQAALQKAQNEYTVRTMTRSTTAVYEETLAPRNILVMKFGSLGDVLLAEPSLRALRQKFPDAGLSVLVKSRYQEVLRHCPLIDEIIEYDNEGRHKGPGLLTLAEELHDRRFDLAVDLQNNWRSHLLGYAARIPRRLGYARKAGRYFFNDAITEPMEKMDPVSHQFYLLKRLGIEKDIQTTRFYGDPADDVWADDFLSKSPIPKGTPLLGVHVGGSSRWSSKQWGLDRFADFINALPQKVGSHAVLVGGKDDMDLIKQLRPMLRVPYADAAGKTNLSRLGALLKRCQSLVGSDSAPLHVAAGVGIPFVAFFGPTDPKRHAPKGPGKILFKDPPCGPCYKPVCPEGHHRCMKDISLNEVIEAVRKYGDTTRIGNSGDMYSFPKEMSSVSPEFPSISQEHRGTP